MAELETRRLLLEPMAERHFEDLAALRADPVVMAQMQFGAETRAQTRATFTAYRATWAARGFGAWAILAKDDRRFLGETGLRLREDDSVALRIAVIRDAWGRGIASEAVAAVLAFAFDEAGLARVTAVSRATNPGAGRVLEKAGFVPVGRVEKNGVELMQFAVERGH